jgi:hypothetical protein
MPKFCENCGASLSDTANFCSSCGKPTGSDVASNTPWRPSTSSGTTKKWILGALVLVVLLGGLGAGAAFHFFHRGGKQADDVTQELRDSNPVTNALPTPAPQPPASPVEPAGFDPNKIVTPDQGQCALFSREELTRVLGTDFTHATADASGCTYKGDLPREFVRTEALWTGGRKLVQLKTDTFAALHQSMINQKYTKAEIASHLFPIAPYPGAGDEAWVDLINIVTARKGDVGIIMDLRYYRDSDDLTRLFVNTALSRLAGDVTPTPTKGPQ